MSDIGTPSKTDIRSKAWRLQSLFGPFYTVRIDWTDEYKVTIKRGGQEASFAMTKEDFDYKDAELLEKFVSPAKTCIERLISEEMSDDRC